MREKKTGMRRLAACVLAAALALGGAATTLATPTVAEAYPSAAIKPKHLKSELSYGESDVIQLSGGKDYRFAGTVDIDHYEVEGGTKDRPTRLYFTDSSSLGGQLTVKRDLTYSQHPLFVLKGGYVEFIGDSGTSTEVRCDGKTFLSDSNDYEARGGVDKPNTGKSLNLVVKNLKLVSRTDNDDTVRAITLYGTMGAGETANFTNVNISGWKCSKNNAFKVDQGNEIYEASPAPVTIRGSRVAVNATFNNCTFKNNTDDCAGALSVVGRAKSPKVTLNGCTFENNSQSVIACDEMKVENDHMHSGNIVVKNAEVALNNCSIRSTSDTSWNGPCSYMFKVWDIQYQMHMTSAIAVAKDASCTINGTVIDDSFVFPSDYFNGRDISGQDEKRCAIYVRGSVTLAGNTKVATVKAKGVDASEIGSYGKVHVDKSFTGEAVLSVDDTKFDPESNKQYYYYEYVNLGSSDLSQEDLASRLKLANENLAYEVTDGKVKVIHRKHEHEWNYSANADGYSIAATCSGQYEASHCVYSRDGETISLMSSKSGDLSFTYNGKQRDAVLVTTKPSQKDNAVAQGKVKIVGARFYRCVDENDTVGIEMEGSQPCDAGTYRVVATVDVEGQNDVTLERVFKINPASLAEKDSNRKDLCKIEVIGYDKLKDNVRFSNGDVLNDVPSYKWTGEEITPRIKVTYKLGDEWIELKEGVDFERLAWGESVSEKDPGAYRSQLWGLGNFASYESIYSCKFFYWSIYGTQFENVQAKGFDGTYDGKAHSPSVTVDNAPEGMQLEYSVDGGSLYEDRIPSYTNVTRDVYGNVCAETIKYRITAPDYVPVEGELQIKIAPADQAAPKDVKTTAATGHALADGSIDGIDGTYEWKAEGASDYQWINEGETSVKGLAAGKYSVRRKADSNHNASEALTVEVKDGLKKADGTGWKHDDAEHWNTCTCGKEDVDRAQHDFEWVVEQDATADKPGSKHERCKTCGYERKSVEIPAFGITGYSGIYDGEKHGVTVDTNTVASIQYREKGEKKWSDESPLICDAGSKTVEFNATLTSGDTCEGEVELKVDPRAITVTADDSSKTYGDFDPALGSEVTEGKLVEGESLQDITVSREAGEAVRKGGYAVTASQTDGANPNYDITFVDGKFTIDRRELTVTWDATTEFTYDGEKHCPTATLGNVMGDDDVSAYVDGAAVKAGAYTAEITELMGADKGNYALLAEGLTCEFSIKNAMQDAPKKVQAVPETVNGKADGKITGVDADMEWRAQGAAEYKAVGKGVTELKGLAAGTYEVRYQAKTNYDPSSDVEVTVAAGRKLKVTLPAEQTGYTLTADATELDWHGSATLKLTVADGYYATKGLAVKANGETIKPSEQGVYQLSKVEKDTKITVEGIVKHEPDGTGWKSDGSSHWHVCTCGERIDVAEHTFEWVIDEKPTVEKPGSKHLHCTVCDYNSSDKVVIPAASVAGYSGEYDGKVHAADVSALPESTAVTYSIDGGVTWSATVPEIKNVGTLPFKYSATVDGAAIEGEAELVVTPHKVTVTASDASKTYGNDDPELGWKVTKGELVEGEPLEGITVSRKAGETVNKGGYVVTASQSEGANSNYEITFKDGKFTIDKRELTVEWDATTEFTYDGEKHCPQATLGNVMGDDDVSAYVDGAAVKAGAYTAEITELTGADKVNYKLPATGLTCKFSIKKAPKGAPVVQGVAETVSARADGRITGVDATMEWRAKDSGEYQAVPEGATELSGLAAGTYEVRYRADDDHEASAATKVTVATGRKLAVALPAEQVGYKLAADATELDWHGSATLTISIEDGYFADSLTYAVKVNGDAVTLNECGEFTVQDIEGDVRVTVEGVCKHEAVSDTWIFDDNTHWHECTCGGKIDEAAHTFTWVVDTPPTATEKGFGHRQCVVCGYALASEVIPAAAISGYSGEYDGAYHTVNASALPEGATAEYSTDDGKTWSTTVPEIKDAGALDVAYKVMVGGATVEGQVTLKVTPRAITVTAQNASKIYGEKDPVFEWSVTSGELVGDDMLELEIEREDCDDVREGGYALQLMQPEGANPNYAITFVDGTFTINQRLLTVTWGTTEFVYDGKEHCPVAELGNVIGKDDLGAFVDGSQTEVGTYTATLAELTGKAAGNYTLPADGLTCEFSIKNAAQDAPVVQAEAETVSGKKDGKITGVDGTMEWRARGAAEYQAVGKDVTELKDLAAGVYEVRYQAKANYDASAVTEVTVKAGRKLVVTLPGNQVGHTLTSSATELDWHGSAKLAISIDGAYFAGKNYAVNVNGKAVKLADDGTYELKDVEGDVNVTVEGVLKHEPDGSGWAHDAKNHWHVCCCGEVLDKAEHTFEWVVDKPATAEAKGERHQECTACGEKGVTEDIAILAPTIIEGAGQAITVDTAKDLSFRSNAPIKYFQKVLVDDKEVDAENYVLTEGSTIVTLKTSFVKTLGVGEHKLSVVSTTGTAETTFTIAEAAKPAPGQTTTTTTTTTTTSKPKKKAGKETLPESGDSAYAMAGAVFAAGMAALLLAWTMKRRA